MTARLGEWHGRLADNFGLTGGVDEEHFARLADGQHPHDRRAAWSSIARFRSTPGPMVSPSLP